MLICFYCEETILPGEPFEPINGGAARVHTECLIRMVAGSAAHQLGDCQCHGGSRVDPPGLSLRAAATLAAETFLMMRDRSA